MIKRLIGVLLSCELFLNCDRHSVALLLHYCIQRFSCNNILIIQLLSTMRAENRQSKSEIGFRKER